METRIQLAKCPFCGGEAKLEYEESTYDDDYECFVRCQTCEAMTKPIPLPAHYVVNEGMNLFNTSPFYTASLLWNSRQNQPNQANATNDSKCQT